MFYELFSKKIKKIKIEDIKDIERFHLSFLKSFAWLGLAVCLSIIGAMTAYMKYQEGNKLGLGFASLILLGAFMFFYMIFEYRVSINSKTGILKHRKLKIELENIESVDLRNMIAPGSKKFQICLDIITKEKQRYIFPLIMNKKDRFVGIIKEKLARKFSVEEE